MPNLYGMTGGHKIRSDHWRPQMKRWSPVGILYEFDDFHEDQVPYEADWYLNLNAEWKPIVIVKDLHMFPMPISNWKVEKEVSRIAGRCSQKSWNFLILWLLSQQSEFINGIRVMSCQRFFYDDGFKIKAWLLMNPDLEQTFDFLSQQNSFCLFIVDS